jgi:hypothetical protein
MQFSEEELEMEAFKSLRSEFAYKYFDNEGALNYEFHVDYCRRKGVVVSDELSGKVPTMSVRALPQSKPIEIFGQDESVFHSSCSRRRAGLDRTRSVGSFQNQTARG